MPNHAAGAVRQDTRFVCSNIVPLRYGLAGQPPLTQLETAKLLQISPSYVSRLETHALELLRTGWEQD